MKTKILLAAAFIALAAGTAYPQTIKMDDAKADRPASAGKQHTATGIVKRADPAKGSVMLAHDPVKSLGWPAMTMTFIVRDNALFKALKADRKIEFVFAQEGKDYVITAAK